MHTVVYGVHVRFWPTLAACHVQGWPEPCISAAYDRVLDEIPAKNKSIYLQKVYHRPLINILWLGQ